VVEGGSPDGGGDEHDAAATKARCGHSTSMSVQRAGAWMSATARVNERMWRRGVQTRVWPVARFGKRMR
jgi:hypothetical protein